MAKFSAEVTQVIDGDRVFTGTYKNSPYSVIFISTDIDYGWQPLSYLPQFSEADSGIAEEYCYEIGKKIERMMS